MELSKEQKSVVDAKDCNLLVSAAAGSGKTSVLVKRILRMITGKHPVDIDRLLVVTFTEAAAAEMKERLHRAILEKLEETPEDRNLQKQAVLVHHAMISTIHSFCNYLLRNHFGQIELDPAFSIGDSGQIELVSRDACETLLEEAYRTASDGSGDELYYPGFCEEFLRYADLYAERVKDTRIEEDIRSLYKQVMSHPRPKEWLLHALAAYEAESVDALLQKPFMDGVVREVKLFVSGILNFYRWALGEAEKDYGPDGYVPVLREELQQFEAVMEAATYIETAERLAVVSFEKLGRNKRKEIDEELKQQIRDGRNKVKKDMERIREQFFYGPPEKLYEDLTGAHGMLRPLVYLTLRYMEIFREKKQEENLIDFNDLEHLALAILLDEKGEPTNIAKGYRDFFATVMTDEYQDSNDVQEAILRAVSRQEEAPNRFMVGDMKQSIYRFRLARPEIFMEKYERYSEAEDAKDRLINLSRNYRSRREVIDCVNAVFTPLMRKEVGEVRYDAAARLYPGAVYPEGAEGEFAPRLLLREYHKDAGEDRHTAQAEMIVSCVLDELDYGRVTRTDAKTGRQYLDRVRPEDIAILFRSSSETMQETVAGLKRAGIPVSTPEQEGFFSNVEVQWILSYLEIILNPRQDAPLAGVLKCPMYGLTDDELALLSLIEKDDPLKKADLLYEKCLLSDNEKVRAFLSDLSYFRDLAGHAGMQELLSALIDNRGFATCISYLPGGEKRRINLDMLLEKAISYEKTQVHGLFGFLEIVRKHKRFQIEMGAGEAECPESVRVMTIHKSKGLEFPVCIVAGLERQFVRKDSGGNLLLNPRWGIGFEFRDGKRRTQTKTILQNRIAACNKRESAGEELRVLYVAMTRAKEKLILAAACEDCEKAKKDAAARVLPDKEMSEENTVISPDAIINAGSFLDWLLYCYGLRPYEQQGLPKIRILTKEDIRISEGEHGFVRQMQRSLLESELKKDHVADPSLTDAIKERTETGYGHEKLKGLFTKTSVSDLKHAAIEEDIQTNVIFETEKPKTAIPAFAAEREEAGGAARGTAYHRFMEVLDFSAFLKRDGADALKEVLTAERGRIGAQGLMTEEDMGLVKEDKVVDFFLSDLGREMVVASASGRLHKEQPFVMEVEATRLNPDFPKEEQVLIQGIIDGYYETEDGIVLMDYKTDRVAKKEDLAARYRVQLDLYREALERLTGKKVKDVLIYSFAFSTCVRSSL